MFAAGKLVNVANWQHATSEKRLIVALVQRSKIGSRA